jgi:hypothetical protein
MFSAMPNTELDERVREERTPSWSRLAKVRRGPKGDAGSAVWVVVLIRRSPTR